MENVFRTFLDNSLRMSLLILFFIAVTKVLSKRYTAKGRYYTWLVVVIGLIIPIRPIINIPLIKIEKEVIASNGLLSNIYPISIIKILELIWILGIVVFIFYNIINHLKFMKLIKRWSYSIDINKVLEDRCSNIGIKKKVKIMGCKFIDSPIIIGVKEPMIILPEREYGKNEIELIIDHELIHLKRGDFWYKLLILFVNGAHWFNPIIYIMVNIISTECEISCDEEVLKKSNIKIRKAYGKIVFDSIFRDKKSRSLLRTNFYGREKGIKNRLYSIMDSSKKSNGIGLATIILLFTILSGTAVFYYRQDPIDSININNFLIKEESVKEILLKEFPNEEVIASDTGGIVKFRDNNVEMVVNKLDER